MSTGLSGFARINSFVSPSNAFDYSYTERFGALDVFLPLLRCVRVSRPITKIDAIAALVQQIGAQTRKSSSHFIAARILNRCGSCVQRYW